MKNLLILLEIFFGPYINRIEKGFHALQLKLQEFDVFNLKEFYSLEIMNSWSLANFIANTKKMLKNF